MSNVAASIAIPLISILLSIWLALHLRRKNASVTAAADFRAALLDAFSGLYPVPSNWPSNIDAHLRQIFPSVQSAVEKFRPHVPRRAQPSYDSAWFAYRLGGDGREIDKQLYHQYMGFTSPGKPAADSKETFRANVNRLLAFASET